MAMQLNAKRSRQSAHRSLVAFVVGAVQSGVANAISQVCQKYGVVYFNTNSSSTTESAKDCHRTKFVWDGNSHNFALAVVKASVDKYGKNWLLLTNDYVWGRDSSASVRKTLERFGGKVIDEILVPVGTRDFSAILLKAQQLKPDVVSPSIGGDDFKAMRQQVIVFHLLAPEELDLEQFEQLLEQGRSAADATVASER